MLKRLVKLTFSDQKLRPRDEKICRRLPQLNNITKHKRNVFTDQISNKLSEAATRHIWCLSILFFTQDDSVHSINRAIEG